MKMAQTNGGNGKLIDVAGTPTSPTPRRPVTLTSIVEDYIARSVPPNEEMAAMRERTARDLLDHVLRAVEHRVEERMGDLPAALKAALVTETRAVEGGIGFEAHGALQARLVRPPRRRNEVGFDEVASSVLVALDVLRMIR